LALYSVSETHFQLARLRLVGQHTEFACSWQVDDIPPKLRLHYNRCNDKSIGAAYTQVAFINNFGELGVGSGRG